MKKDEFRQMAGLDEPMWSLEEVYMIKKMGYTEKELKDLVLSFSKNYVAMSADIGFTKNEVLNSVEKYLNSKIIDSINVITSDDMSHLNYVPKGGIPHIRSGLINSVDLYLMTYLDYTPESLLSDLEFDLESVGVYQDKTLNQEEFEATFIAFKTIRIFMDLLEKYEEVGYVEEFEEEHFRLTDSGSKEVSKIKICPEYNFDCILKSLPGCLIESGEEGCTVIDIFEYFSTTISGVMNRQPVSPVEERRYEFNLNIIAG